MPEADFWHRQNPARLNALYSAYFTPAQPSQQANHGIRADGSGVGSLSNYLTGG